MTAQPAESGIAPVPEQGQLVVVRQRTYTVTDVIQSSIAADPTSSAQSERAVEKYRPLSPPVIKPAAIRF